LAAAAEAEAEPSLISDFVESKQVAEAEAFFISDSVAAELFLIFLKLRKITCRLREVFVISEYVEISEGSL